VDVDSSTIVKLLSAHERRIHYVACRYRGYGIDQEDLVQEGMIGLLKAIRKYDPQIGIPLWGFAIVYVRAEMRRAIGRLDGDKGLRKRVEFPTDLDALHGHLVETMTPEDLCIAVEQHVELEDRIEHLPEREREVLKLSMDPEDLSPPDIGKRLKLCLTSVTTSKTKGIRHLRRHMVGGSRSIAGGTATCAGRARSTSSRCAAGLASRRRAGVCRVA
jgi:RNA polymerase sigma factor (sigma-70 family)